ncbi:hypothetical protein [Curtobacterium herbarum]|uniref:Uncharacterized protein n=1 Tax=Curtobacterium herbarum TaxID=150122 RepID=A0ABP4K817_9MICO|nr:hypothetical protein [Curtobacterium herbarum]MBM7475687.1 hypothetical protein [Curtobacterium herbarum]MCS6543599.1 hypothetical protein [Curtobacterium herbarum]
MRDESVSGDWPLEPVWVSLRRLGVVLLVIITMTTTLVLTAWAGIERITAVPGWGHCVVLCHDVPIPTVERVTGVDFPRGSTVVRSTGVRTDSEVHEWVRATVRVPKAHPVAVGTAPPGSHCSRAAEIDELERSGVRAVHGGWIATMCVVAGVDADGNQVIVIV